VIPGDTTYQHQAIFDRFSKLFLNFHPNALADLCVTPYTDGSAQRENHKSLVWIPTTFIYTLQANSGWKFDVLNSYGQ